MASREVSDGTRTIERWTNEGTPGYYAGDPLTRQRALTADEAADLAAMDAANTAATNRGTLTDKATAAIAANVTYLGIASPTNAQVAAQVKALTREATAVIRLLLDRTDDTAGT